jgi:hypothetical protein
MPFDHPTDGEDMAKGMNARSASAGTLANPGTVSKSREGLVTRLIAKVSTPLRHEESIRQSIVAQNLPVGSVLSYLLDVRCFRRAKATPQCVGSGQGEGWSRGNWFYMFTPDGFSFFDMSHALKNVRMGFSQCK